MSGLAGEGYLSPIKWLPQLEASSAEHDIARVINASTSDIYSFVADGQILGSYTGMRQMGAHVIVIGGSHATYFMVVTTAEVCDGYDPGLVSALKHADNEKPEATFTNVIDMMEWLERE